MTVKLLVAFALTELLLSLTPGPAVLLVISHGLRAGLRGSVPATLGILTGNLVYFAVSAIGIGAVLLSMPGAFRILRLLGAAYLVVMGLRMLFMKTAAVNSQSVEEPTGFVRPFKSFLIGVLTQLSNPKALLYFTSLLPQFISHDTGLPKQFVILGAISVLVEFPVLLGYGYLAHRSRRLIVRRAFAGAADRIAGAFLVCVGVALGFSRS